MSEESTVSVQVPAEVSKISDALVSAVSAYKKGDSWQVIGAGLLPTVLGEMGSFEELKSELTDDRIYVAGGILLGSLVGVLVAKQAQSYMAKRKAKAPAIQSADGQVPAAHEVVAH